MIDKELLKSTIEKFFPEVNRNPDKGYVAFWATSEKDLAESFAKESGWKDQFVIVSSLDADLIVVYNDENKFKEVYGKYL